MNCDKYRQHELGELDEVGFQRHASTCPTCKERVSQDARLMALAGDLEPPDPAPFLWDRIEATMVAEQGRRNRRRTWVYRVAAVLVVGLGLGSFLHERPVGAEDTPSNLYTATALEKVRDRELEYAAAIEELQQVAGARLELMDMELMVLYRDKMETIDTQIARCQQALRRNPANTHIHRYLFLALQDKKETLQEILQIEL